MNTNGLNTKLTNNIVVPIALSSEWFGEIKLLNKLHDKITKSDTQKQFLLKYSVLFE